MTTKKLTGPMLAALRQLHEEGPGSTLPGVGVSTALAIEARGVVQVDRGESGHGKPHYALAADGYQALGLDVPDPLPTPQAGHVVTLEGPDSAGHWAWRCLRSGCYADASGYEPQEVVEESAKHGPLAANSPTPAPEDEDAAPDTIEWTDATLAPAIPHQRVQFVLDEGCPVDPDGPDGELLQDTLDRLIRMGRKAGVNLEPEPTPRATEMARLIAELVDAERIADGDFSALGMLIVDAGLACDVQALVVARRELGVLIDRQGGDVKAEARGRLISLRAMADTMHARFSRTFTPYSMSPEQLRDAVQQAAVLPRPRLDVDSADALGYVYADRHRRTAAALGVEPPNDPEHILFDLPVLNLEDYPLLAAGGYQIAVTGEWRVIRSVRVRNDGVAVFTVHGHDDLVEIGTETVAVRETDPPHGH